ncbi:hypothetical protein TIFTF001_024674 [Ficus carica]|uniref:DNA-directed RNA polymerase n=1 Tax=Ficus carica TaxID=3494 RepID=A0AA88DKE9_FICCA|nr:hypothetical protein TIFTF001_024674 [Ficus carica]
MLLKEMNIGMNEILQKCEDAINSFRKKKLGKHLKKAVLSVSECCSFNKSGFDDGTSQVPCLLISMRDNMNDTLEESSKNLADSICPFLLETTIKGDPRICSANITWISPDATTWIWNPRNSNVGELALDILLEKSAVKQSGDAWRIVIDSCLPVLHLIDTRRSIPYGIKQIQELLGISSVFDLAVQRVSNSVSMVSKGVLKEHLLLLANSMTYCGNMIGFNSGGYKALSRSLNVQVPFTEATLITPKRCFEKAAEKCHVDSLTSIVASCSWGKHVAVGTGSRFDILWDTREVEFNPEGGVDVHNFLHMVNTACGDELTTSCLGEEIDDMMPGDDIEGLCSSPENLNSDKPTFEDIDEFQNISEKDLPGKSGWESLQTGSSSGKDWGSDKNVGAKSDAWSSWGTSNKEIQEGFPSTGQPDTSRSNGWGNETQDNAGTGWERGKDEGHNLFSSKSEESSKRSDVWDGTPGWGTNRASEKVSLWNNANSEDGNPRSNDWNTGPDGTTGRENTLSGWHGEKSENVSSGVGWNKSSENVSSGSGWNKSLEKVSSGAGWNKSSENVSSGMGWNNVNSEDGHSRSNDWNTKPDGTTVGTENTWSGWHGEKSENVSSGGGWNKSSEKVSSGAGWNKADADNGHSRSDDWNTASERTKTTTENTWSGWHGGKSEKEDIVSTKSQQDLSRNSGWGSVSNRENSTERAFESVSRDQPLPDEAKESCDWDNKLTPQKAASGWLSSNVDGWTKDADSLHGKEPADSPAVKISWEKRTSPDISQSSELNQSGFKNWVPNGEVGSEVEKPNEWAKRSGSFKKRNVETSGGWGSDSGDWKIKKNRPGKFPGTNNETTSTRLFTETRQRLDIFTSEEQDVLSHIEPIMKSIRRIMHKSGYNDGDPIQAEDQSYIIDNVFNYHPDKAAKMGSGIDHLMVSKHSTFQESRCFFVVSTDGRKEDFSYRKCLDNLVRSKFSDVADEFLGKYFRKPRSGGNQERISTPEPNQERISTPEPSWNNTTPAPTPEPLLNSTPAATPEPSEIEKA